MGGEYKNLGNDEKIMEETLNNVRQIEDKSKSNTRKWLRKSNLKGCTEAWMSGAQEQSLKTNYVKFHIDKTTESALCRICRLENETVSHIASQCKMLSQKKYKKRHDNVCRYIHWRLCKKMALKEHHSGTSISQIELLRTKETNV